MKEHYNRVGIIKPDELFSQLGDTSEENEKKVMDAFGKRISLKSVRYLCYKKKGVTCVTCGINGHYFAAEKDIRQNGNPRDKYHLNLYHLLQNGSEIMITVDHIIPASKGGQRTVENLQPMCERCNAKKADKITGEVPSIKT